MFFGDYSHIKDECAHIVIALIVSLIGYVLHAYDFAFFLACFLAAVALDIDHIFNSSLAGILKLAGYAGSVSFGSNGYTIKILHGFDIAFLLSLAAFFLTSQFYFALFMWINLCAHELWDFIVYPHSWRELFLATRWQMNFRPGFRRKATGLIFNLSSLRY